MNFIYRIPLENWRGAQHVKSISISTNEIYKMLGESYSLLYISPLHSQHPIGFHLLAFQVFTVVRILYMFHVLPLVRFRRLLSSSHSNHPNQSSWMCQLHCFVEQHALLHVLLDLIQRWLHLQTKQRSKLVLFFLIWRNAEILNHVSIVLCASNVHHDCQ